VHLTKRVMWCIVITLRLSWLSVFLHILIFSLKPLDQLKASLIGMFIGWFSTNKDSGFFPITSPFVIHRKKRGPNVPNRFVLNEFPMKILFRKMFLLHYVAICCVCNMLRNVRFSPLFFQLQWIQTWSKQTASSQLFLNEEKEMHIWGVKQCVSIPYSSNSVLYSPFQSYECSQILVRLVCSDIKPNSSSTFCSSEKVHQRFS
jgi:hypothetical protein